MINNVIFAEFLYKYIIYICIIEFLFILFSIWYTKKYWIKYFFKKMNKKNLYILILLILITTLVKFFFIPFSYDTEDDEAHRIVSAISFLKSGERVWCLYGNNDHCFGKRLIPQPPGQTSIFIILFSIFGINKYYAFYLNSILSSLTIFLVYILSYIIFKDFKASLLSSIIYAIIPGVLRYANTATSEVTVTFFILLSLIYYYFFEKTRDKNILYFFILTLAFSNIIRTETVILTAIVGVILLFSKKINIKTKITIFTLLVILEIPFIIYTRFGQESHIWGFGVEYFKHNISVNTSFWFNDNYFPSILTIFAILSIFMINKNKYFTMLMIYALFLFLIYSSFWSGHNNIRYNSMIYPFVAISSSFFINKLSEKKIIILILLGIISIESYYEINGIIQRESPVINEELFLERSLKSVQNNCWIFSTEPHRILVIRNINIVTNSNRASILFKNKKCLYVYKGIRYNLHKQERNYYEKFLKGKRYITIYKNSNYGYKLIKIINN